MATRLLTFEEELERTNYIEAVANQYRISIDSLTKLVVQMAVTKGMAPEYNKPKKPKEYREKKEDSGLIAQRALLTWMLNRKDVYMAVKKYVTPYDFTSGLYQTVAELLYEQYDNDNVNPSKIINHYNDENEHSQVASLFHTNINGVDEESRIDVLTKAIKETIIKVKTASINKATQEMDPTSMDDLVKLMNNKKELEELKKIEITLRDRN